jgi:FHA domain
VTDWDGFQARVHPGAGIVARAAGGALVIPAPAGQEQTVDQLLGLIRDASPGGGRALARKLAGVLATAEGDETLDLALLAPLAGDDVAVLVVGDIEVSAETAEGSITVSGRDSLTWVDRVLRRPTQLRITPGTGAGDALAASDLLAGVVPGSGLSLAPRGGAAIAAAMAAPESVKDLTPPAPEPVRVLAPPALDIPVAAPPAPVVTVPPIPTPPIPTPPVPPVVAPPAPPSDFQVESLTGDPGPARDPLPVDAAEEPIPVGSVQAQVKGVFCKRGHFNDPMVQFCTVCGINMVQQTPALVDGPRPPLGVLVFDDGSVYQLEQDYVLGRQPEGAPEVVSGAARPLRLEDSGGTVSRAHALISLEGWTVRLSDHGSANGTYIAMLNSPDWQPVPPNGRVVLAPGTTIKLGNRTLKYESHRGQR